MTTETDTTPPDNEPASEASRRRAEQQLQSNERRNRVLRDRGQLPEEPEE